jgi:hypothetical protein
MVPFMGVADEYIFAAVVQRELVVDGTAIRVTEKRQRYGESCVRITTDCLGR